MLLAFGVVCALFEARTSGRGQVVDAAMTDGVSLLMAMTYSLKAKGLWRDERQANLLDGGAPFYGVYAAPTASGSPSARWSRSSSTRSSTALGLDAARFRRPLEPASWPALARGSERPSRERTRDEWAALFEDTDACVAPVLDMDEAPRHPHNVARATFLDRRRRAAAGAGPALFAHASPKSPARPRRSERRARKSCAKAASRRSGSTR